MIALVGMQSSGGAPDAVAQIKKAPNIDAFPATLRHTVCLLHAVLAVEAIDPASRIEHLLLTGIKGVALRADFNVEVFIQRGSGRERLSTAAGNLDIGVVWVRIGLHGLTLN